MNVPITYAIIMTSNMSGKQVYKSIKFGYKNKKK